MKLHHLRMRGIGPFRDEVEIDLAALSASGTFLLEGPTGSGKSTILDAVVFGLYGQVAGEGSGLDRVRSQFAPPSEASFVDLVFETSAGIFRVRREPAFERPKRRGTGTTTQQARALLWRLTSPELIPAAIADRAGDGAGVEVRATRLDEVGAQITAAIGLNREQFTQTVLLPQGEFQRFLRAATAERQQVLTRVFGTELYEQVEKELAERRRGAKQLIEHTRSRLHAVVARYVEASGHEQAPEGADTPGPQEPAALAEHADAMRLDELSADADAIAAAVAEAAREKAEAAQVAAAELERRRLERTAAEQRVTLLRRRTDLDALAHRLEEERPQIAAAASARDRHAVALPLVGALDRAHAASTAAARAREALAALVERTRGDHSELPALLSGDDPLAELAAVTSDETARVGELRALVEVEAGLEARERDLVRDREGREGLREKRAALAAEAEALPERRSALTEQLREARTGESAGAEARAHAERTAAQLTAARRAHNLLAGIAAAEMEVGRASVAAQTAIDEEHALRSRRRASLAAELAEKLASGDPCPVCGSAEHPAPAAPGADHVGEEAITAAEETRRAADAALAEAARQLEVLRERRSGELERAAGLTPEQAQEADAHACAAVAAAVAHGQRAAALDARIAQHDEHERRTRAALGEHDTAIAERTARITAAEAALAADHDRIRAARGDHASVGARVGAHETRARTAATLREALVAADQAAARAAELEADASSARNAAREELEDPTAFAQDADARAAVLPPRERDRLQHLIEQQRIDTARLADGMAEPGIAEAIASETALAEATAALESTAAAVAAAQTEARSAQAAAGTAANTAERTRAARMELGRATAEAEKARAEAGAVLRVADLVTGGDGGRIRLSTYVLMRRFEDVVDAANARLARMGEAQYELLRDDTGRGAQRTGLDLLVIDRHTDRARRPETLSGGETFFVSLALALGLADVVSAEAGGVQMQTLFIDEGFGSLDPERLDNVIEEIGRIAQAGRSVGIVSHVAELKTRIPDQISVRRRPDNTSELTVRA